jgi:tetratricopeptide (TPR) repeat protein
MPQTQLWAVSGKVGQAQSGINTARKLSVVRTMSLALLLAGLASTARAHDQAEHRRGEVNPERVGNLSFPVSCRPDQQKKFEQAVAVLHSFWYEESERLFREILEADPTCAIALWGVAMSLYHPLWQPPDRASFESGVEAVSQATQIGAKTERERDYIAAIGRFYADSDKRDHETRARDYTAAMKELTTKYPADSEAAVFYALALLGTASPTDQSYTNQKIAGPILERIFETQPDHPGVAHYIIHSYDNAVMAPQAIAAARHYSRIAPLVPHVQHMPSHIFTRLGLWEDSVQSNLASAKASKLYEEKSQPGEVYYEYLHALDYLEYAYLQLGQFTKAAEVVEEATSITKVKPEAFQAAFAFATIPSRFALEQRRWADAAMMEFRSAGIPLERFAIAHAAYRFARGLGAARSGQLELARTELESLRALHARMVAGGDRWSTQVEAESLGVAAWLAHAEGNPAQAEKLLRQAADLEDGAEKHPVTPGELLPAREMLGELLLELKRPHDALKEYVVSLRISPNRMNGYLGAARAAIAAGDEQSARIYYRSLLDLARHADPRPELDQARTYLEKSGGR